MKYRKSLRLEKYDYSQEGYYFITICTHERNYYFDNDISKNIINKYWYKLKEKFNDVKLDQFIIMPNHIHGIIIIENNSTNNTANSVGADPCVCPINENDLFMDEYQCRVNTWVDPYAMNLDISLFKIIQWFKTMTTNEYINCVKNNTLKPFNKKIWQRNYYEHIIRNGHELNKIREYIINNPLKWDIDKNNIN